MNKRRHPPRFPRPNQEEPSLFDWLDAIGKLLALGIFALGLFLIYIAVNP